jgi:hypothetical protein
MTRRFWTSSAFLIIAAAMAFGTAPLDAGEPGVNAAVDFSNLTREWDGFGVNYVELAQSPDYDEWPQEYGGFMVPPPGPPSRSSSAAVISTPRRRRTWHAT